MKNAVKHSENSMKKYVINLLCTVYVWYVCANNQNKNRLYDFKCMLTHLSNTWYSAQNDFGILWVR